MWWKKSGREMLCALSLVVKYAQRVVVLSSFPVQWPEDVSSAQTAHQSAGLNADTVKAISIGCLAEEQSIELLMSYRWLTPVLLMTACLLASPGSRVVGRLLRMCRSTKLHKFGESAPFGAVSACTPMVELYILFSTSAINNSISLMTCRHGPSVTTVVAFRSSSATAEGGGDGCHSPSRQPRLGLGRTSFCWAGLSGVLLSNGGNRGVRAVAPQVL